MDLVLILDSWDLHDVWERPNRAFIHLLRVQGFKVLVEVLDSDLLKVDV